MPALSNSTDAPPLSLVSVDETASAEQTRKVNLHRDASLAAEGIASRQPSTLPGAVPGEREQRRWGGTLRAWLGKRAVRTPKRNDESSYEAWRRRQLKAALPSVAWALWALVGVYAVADRLSEKLESADVSYYALMGVVPLYIFAARRWSSLSPLVIALCADASVTILLVLRTLTPTGTMSGAAQMVSLKMVATALMFPWPAHWQLASVAMSMTTLLGALAYRAAAGEAVAVHQWVGPLLAAALSVSAVSTIDATRRRAFRRRAALIKSEAQLRALFESSPDGIFVVCRDKVVVANQRCAKMLGRGSAADFHERDWREFVEGADQDSVAQLLDDVSTGSAVADSVDIELRGAKGALPTAITAAALRYRGAACVQVTMRNIHRRRRAEALFAAERLAFEVIASGQPIAEQLDAICELVEHLARGAACSIMRIDESGKKLRLGAARNLPPGFITAIDGQPIAPGGGVGGTAPFWRQTVVVTDVTVDPIADDFRRLCIEHGIAAGWSTPIVSSTGSALGLLAVYYDAPHLPSAEEQQLVERATHLASVALQRQVAEHSLRQQTLVFAGLARVGHELIAAIDKPLLTQRLCEVSCEVLQSDFAFIALRDANAEYFAPVAVHGLEGERWEALRATHVSLEVGRPILSALSREPSIQINSESSRDLLDAAPMVPQELRRGRNPVARLLAPLRRGDDIVGVLVAGDFQRSEFTEVQELIIRGISQVGSLALETARLMGDLERANRVKADFVATMSHELRTPLNVIIGYQDLLGEKILGPLTEEQSDTLQRLRVYSRNLLELINATLDLSRLESGTVTVDVRPVEVAQLMRELQTESEEAWGDRDIKLRWTGSGDVPQLATDVIKLKVVLKSLIGNAVKFTERGTVSVGAAGLDGGVEFTVTDSGIGISAARQAAIFEPFTQADPSIAARFGGTGLGLHIVRRLVDLLGGRVSVDSVLGQGSTFRVWIPQRAA